MAKTFTFKLNVDALKKVAGVQDIKTISPTLIASASDVPNYYDPHAAAAADIAVDVSRLEVRIPVYGREQYITLSEKNPTFEISVADDAVIAWYSRLVSAIDAKYVTAGEAAAASDAEVPGAPGA